MSALAPQSQKKLDAGFQYRDPRSRLPAGMTARSPSFPFPLETRLRTGVHLIRVEEILHHLDRFGARVSHPSLEAEVLKHGSIALNSVLNGGFPGEGRWDQAWDAMIGLKYWAECCSQTSLSFLVPEDTPPRSFPLSTETLMFNPYISYGQLLVLQTWARYAMSIFVRFRFHFPHNFVEHLERSRENFEDGRFMITTLKGPPVLAGFLDSAPADIGPARARRVELDTFNEQTKKKIRDLAAAMAKANAAMEADIAAQRDKHAKRLAEATEEKAEDMVMINAADVWREEPKDADEAVMVDADVEEDWEELPMNTGADVDWIVV